MSDDIIDNDSGKVVNLRDETRRRREEVSEKSRYVDPEDKEAKFLDSVSRINRRRLERAANQARRLADIDNKVIRNISREVLEMVAGGLEDLGGRDYIVYLGLHYPVVMGALIARCLPQQSRLSFDGEGNEERAVGFVVKLAGGPGGA